MNYRICPRCRNLTSRSSAFCLFCGKALRRGAGRTPQESPSSTRTSLTGAAIAQRALCLFALLLFAGACALPLIGSRVSSQSAVLPELPEATAVPRIGESSPGGPASSDDIFSVSNGQYSVVMFISEVTGGDPEAKAAADALSGERFDGTLTVAVDAYGSGTLSIGQAFFSPEAIQVSAFQNESGVRSDNTLYGVVERDGMKLSIVCVCADGEISGFIWMDNALTHIEFLYFS